MVIKPLPFTNRDENYWYQHICHYIYQYGNSENEDLNYFMIQYERKNLNIIFYIVEYICQKEFNNFFNPSSGGFYFGLEKILKNMNNEDLPMNYNDMVKIVGRALVLN